MCACSITIYDIKKVDEESDSTTLMDFKVSGLSPAPKPVSATPSPTVVAEKPKPQPTLPQFSDSLVDRPSDELDPKLEVQSVSSSAGSSFKHGYHYGALVFCAAGMGIYL